MPSKKKQAPVFEAPVQINPEVLQELIPGAMSAEGVPTALLAPAIQSGRRRT